MNKTYPNTSGIALFVLIFALVAPSLTWAQKIEITPFIGYQFNGKVRYVEGEYRVNDNANWGVAVDIAVSYDSKIELLYSNNTTTASFFPYRGGYPEGSSDLTIHMLQIGGVQEVGDGAVRGFGVFTLGASFFEARNADESGGVYVQDVWRFAVTMGGGAKIFVTRNIGFRLQGRLMLPLVFGGVGAGCGIGTGGAGCGLTMSSWAPLVMGDLSIGLIVAFGD